ncbi:MAG: hypothetical protein RSF82_08320 [Angelakisella sp.]
MKKRLLIILLTVLSTVLFLSACGKVKKDVDIELLLSNDYEVEYIFTRAGLSIDGAKPLETADGGIYHPVQSDKYKTIADLYKLLSETYANDETITAYMGSVDSDGRLLYLDIDGKLCRSSNPIVSPGNPTADYDSIKAEKMGKGEHGKQRVLFRFTENGEDGSEYQCVMEAVDTGKDGWRLWTSRATAVREIIKQGTGDTVANDVHTIADSFVTALGAGDTATIERLTQTQGGGYSHLSQAGITEASYEVVEELDYEGEYLVTLHVSGGNGVFKTGTNTYRMRVGYSDKDGELIVRYFQPSSFEPYDQLLPDKQTNIAANQVLYLARLVGAIEFTSPADIPAEVITEYVLWMTEMQGEPDPAGISLAELQTQVKNYFGIEGFDPGKDTIFYNADTDSYFMMGRGLPPFNMFVLPISDGNGIATIEVYSFDPTADPLMLAPVSTTLYTLNNNWNGSYTFVNGIKKPLI